MEKQKIKEFKKDYECLVFAIIKKDNSRKNLIPKEYNVILDLIEYIEELNGWNLTKELLEDCK